MEYVVKEPLRSVSESVGIVLLNHMGSSHQEDSGRDGQYLANEFGLAVIVANRPGSGSFQRSTLLRDMMDRNYPQTVRALGQKLDRAVYKLGLQEVILAGRSAGGLGALALAYTETLPATQLYAAETVAWEAVPSREGRTRYRQYNKNQKHMLRNDSANHLIHPEKPDVRGKAALRRLVTMPLLARSDMYHHEEVWTKPHALQLSLSIAAHLLDLGVNLEFAEHSLALTPSIWERLRALPDLRASRGGSKPFRVERVPHTVHASFDRRSFFATRLRPSIDSALQAA